MVPTILKLTVVRFTVNVMPSLARYAVNNIAVLRVMCIMFTLQSFA
jgi:hypothetical protein